MIFRKTRSLQLIIPLLLSVSFTVQAQVNIQFTHTGYITSKDQLWNIMLVNTGATLNPVRVEISLRNIANNQPLCKFTSRGFPLNAGPKVLSLQDALPVQTINYSPGFTDPGPYGVLPAGKYMMCTDLYQFDGELWTNIGNDCDEVEVVAFSPVILTLPEDMATLENTNPMLTWLSPLPVAQFTQLQYDLLIVPVNKDQTAVDAIERNIPLVTATNIPATAYSYLSSFPALQPGKIYSWRVTAKNNGSIVSVSETWTFSIRNTETVSLKIKPIVYTPLKRGDNNSFVTTTGEIGFEYLNMLNDGQVTIRIIDHKATQPAKRLKTEIQQKLVYGQNYIAIDTREQFGLETNRSYQVVLTNSRGEEWTMNFYLK